MHRITLSILVAVLLFLSSCKKEDYTENIAGEWRIDDEQIIYSGETSIYIGPGNGNYVYKNDGTGLFKYNGSSNPFDIADITWYLSYDHSRMSINYAGSSGITAYEISMPQSDRMTLKTTVTFSIGTTTQILTLSKIQ